MRLRPYVSHQSFQNNTNVDFDCLLIFIYWIILFLFIYALELIRQKDFCASFKVLSYLSCFCFSQLADIICCWTTEAVNIVCFLTQTYCQIGQICVICQPGGHFSISFYSKEGILLRFGLPSGFVFKEDISQHDFQQFGYEWDHTTASLNSGHCYK